jgi:hypothetical protein
MKVEVDSAKLRIYYLPYFGSNEEAEKQIEDFFKKKFTTNKKVSGDGKYHFSNEYSLDTALTQGITQEQYNNYETAKAISAHEGCLWWGSSFNKPVGKLAICFHFPFSLKMDKNESYERNAKKRKLDPAKSDGPKTKDSIETKITTFEQQIIELVNNLKAISSDANGVNIAKTAMLSFDGRPETVRLRDITERCYELILDVDSMQLSNFIKLCDTAVNEINKIREHWKIDTEAVDRVEIKLEKLVTHATHGNHKRRLVL